MNKLEPRIEAIRAEYGLEASDFWQIPQNKQWVCKHSALEVVAAKSGMWFYDPQIIEADTANGIAVLAVKGTLDKRVEWSTGEASPKNNKNAYPWAMAEKRAKDRVILKLAGLHGFVYSDSEGDFEPPSKAPERQQEAPKPEAPKMTAAAKKELWASLMNDLKVESAKGTDAIDRFMNNSEVKADIARLSDWSKNFREEAIAIYKIAKEVENEFGQSVEVKSNYTPPDFDKLGPSPTVGDLLNEMGS